MKEAIIAIQIPHQGRRMVFSHLTMEDFVNAVMNRYEAYDTEDEAINELMHCDPRYATLAMCRAALSHDNLSAEVFTMPEAVLRVRQNGPYSLEIAAELEDWGWTSETRYMHPQSGDVQRWSDWKDDSLEWEGDIDAQLATLIPVVMDADGNWAD